MYVHCQCLEVTAFANIATSAERAYNVPEELQNYRNVHR